MATKQTKPRVANLTAQLVRSGRIGEPRLFDSLFTGQKPDRADPDGDSRASLRDPALGIGDNRV